MKGSGIDLDISKEGYHRLIGHQILWMLSLLGTPGQPLTSSSTEGNLHMLQIRNPGHNSPVLGEITGEVEKVCQSA